MSSSPKRVRALRSTISQPAAASRAATRSSAARPSPLSLRGHRGDDRRRRDRTDAGAPVGVQRHSTDADSCAPRVGFGSVASPPCSPRRRHSPSTASRPGPVRVEVDVHRGLPAFSVVGLPDAAVREARERVRAALANCGFEFPLRRIVANLAPASLRKAGPGLDLAIAAALLTASGQLELGAAARGSALVGELALDGSVRAGPRRAGDRRGGARARRRGDRRAGRERPRGGAGRGHRGDPRSRASSSSPALAGGEWAPERPQPLPLALEPDGRRRPTSPTCAASATSATRSRSPPPAGTAC